MDGPAKDPQGELARLQAENQALKAQLERLASESQVANHGPASLEQPGFRVQTPHPSTSLRSLQRKGTLRSKEAEQLLNMIESLTGVTIWRLDRTNGVSECSDQLREIFGLGLDESFRLQDVYERFHPEDRAKVRFDGRAHPVSDTMEPGEFRVMRPDGSMRRIISTVAPLRDEDDNDVWVGIVVDVTERYALEEELKNAQKMEALGRLAGGVAHDFNNYLTVALGNAEMLRAGVHQDNSRALLDEIIGASERCHALTRRLLEFGRKRLVKAPVINILDVVAQSQAILRRLLPTTMTFDVQVPQREVKVRIDAGKLEQAIMNLVLNARDATQDDGCITLTLSCDESPPLSRALSREGEESGGERSFVRIGVEDQGAGMDEETRSRVFEPFFTTKPAGRGTGLGLSIVYGIVAHAGGFMDVHSAPDEGSRFEIWLPMAG